jgi:hypothetical protein
VNSISSSATISIVVAPSNLCKIIPEILFGYKRNKRVVSAVAMIDSDIKEDLKVDMDMDVDKDMVEQEANPHIFQLQ